MLARLRRALLVMLICIFPMQSMAAVLVPLTCSPHESHHAVASGHDSHDAAGHSHSDDAPGGATHDHAADGHLCCHQFSSAAPSVQVVHAPQDFRVYSATVRLLTPLHIPELPQRPPRA